MRNFRSGKPQGPRNAWGSLEPKGGLENRPRCKAEVHGLTTISQLAGPRRRPALACAWSFVFARAIRKRKPDPSGVYVNDTKLPRGIGFVLLCRFWGGFGCGGFGGAVRGGWFGGGVGDACGG